MTDPCWKVLKRAFKSLNNSSKLKNFNFCVEPNSVYVLVVVLGGAFLYQSLGISTQLAGWRLKTVAQSYGSPPPLTDHKFLHTFNYIPTYYLCMHFTCFYINTISLSHTPAIVKNTLNNPSANEFFSLQDKE